MCRGVPTAEASCSQHQGLACPLHGHSVWLRSENMKNTFHADLSYQMKLLLHTATATDFSYFC